MNLFRNIDIMGIVNLTDDSFYAGSRCSDTAQVLAKVGRFISEGATIIDFGACSTRPGALPVGPDCEWERLEPVLSAVRKAYPEVQISVDTYWADVVRRTYDLIGDFIVNDISAGETDSAMLPLVGSLGLRYIAMHMRGTPENMQLLTDYSDVTDNVLTFFKQFEEKALKNGIDDWILDPGFGFAKTIEQNYQLLSRLDSLKTVGRPLLVGVSRKSMVYKLLGISPEEALAPTQVLHYKALCQGADILRVHDVAEAARTVEIYRNLQA